VTESYSTPKTESPIKLPVFVSARRTWTRHERWAQERRRQPERGRGPASVLGVFRSWHL